ncbi:MAG: tRNA (adenosine(37)-N6)-threonylcarbamoyltransferase complex transferase subunit TsaD [Alphaproteobacteria bacterium]|nr:tRNA (adenosine(37)-N6)-threonylcarbamoyltransferase complex transferase subunit TsaD [Alphaproteobacteria bacterium]
MEVAAEANDLRRGAPHLIPDDPECFLAKTLTVLGIETSCDETAAAVVRGCAPGPGEILSNVIADQIAEHAPFGGVVPEIAARAHVSVLDRVIERALSDAGVSLAQLDGIAATAGPGLIGGVAVGLTMAKALCLASGKPLVALNHLEAHALTARLTYGAAFPFLLLLVSGGHCQLLVCEGVGRFTRLGTTIDDAAGEAFDKTAKLLGLGFPGGPAIEKAAVSGNPRRFRFPRPLLDTEGFDFSFSGLKTAVRRVVDTTELTDQMVCDIAASFQAAAVEVLVERSKKAMQAVSGRAIPVRRLVVAGGVAANRLLSISLSQAAAGLGFELLVAPAALCTDNGAMVAWAGLERLGLGLVSGLDVSPRARWPLDASRAAIVGAKS